MTTGVCCPTCEGGITSKKDQPCRSCEIDAMRPCPRKALAVFVLEHINGTARQKPDKEIGQ